MARVDEWSTSPTLLSEVSDWRNDQAWVSFHDRYDPLLRRWCRVRGLDEDSADEVCQRIWIELADRMRTFRYDPTGAFRGWLKRLCDSRVIDFLRQRRAGILLLDLDERDDGRGAVRGTASIDPVEGDRGEGDEDLPRLLLLDEAGKVQATVRGKVSPRTWEAFWLVAVRDWSVQDAAEALEMTRIAVYAATARVAQMLGDEGKRGPGR
jgi:RNA polymerase sigma-70 factor (ECF subfamily)